MSINLPGLRNRLKLRQLALLVAIEEEGTLHAAARRNGMTQPAATRLLAEFEALVGESLFQRSRQGMTPTDMGRLMIRHAGLILGGVEHAFAEAREVKAGEAGQLRVGQFSSAPPSFLLRAILQLKQSSPQLTVRVIEGPQAYVVAGVRDGDLQLALTRAPSKESADDFQFDVLFYERFSVVCGPRSRRRLRANDGISSLIEAPWVLPLTSTPVRASLDLHFWAQCGRIPGNVIEFAAHTSAALLHLIQNSDYVGLIPSQVAADYARRKQVRVLLTQVPDLVGPVGLLTRKGEVLPPTARRLVQAIQLQLAEP